MQFLIPRPSTNITQSIAHQTHTRILCSFLIFLLPTDRSSNMAPARDQSKSEPHCIPLAQDNLRRGTVCFSHLKLLSWFWLRAVEHETFDARFLRTPPSDDPWTPFRCSSTGQQRARGSNSGKRFLNGNEPVTLNGQLDGASTPSVEKWVGSRVIVYRCWIL